MPTDEMGRSAQARSEHPSPISEGEIEEGLHEVEVERLAVQIERWEKEYSADSEEDWYDFLARKFLSRCGRDEAIEGAINALRRMLVADPGRSVALHAHNEALADGMAAIRSLVSDDKERGSAAGAAPFDHNKR